MSRRASALIGTVAALSGLFVLSACGSSSSNDASSSTQSSGSSTSAQAPNATTSSCVNAAKTAVATEEKPISPVYSTASVDAAKSKGKTVWMIQNTITPFVTAATQAFQQAGQAAGIDTKVVNGNGAIPQIDSGVSEAIAQHAGGIVLYAVNLATVATEIKAAKAAGIPVVDLVNGQSASENPASEGVYGHVTEDAALGGKIAADWMLDYTGCHLNTAILGGSVVTPHVLAAAGTKAEIQKLCGSSCKSQFVNLDLSQLVTEAQQQAQQVLRRDPSINVMYPQFDGAVPYVIAGLKQAGDQSKVKLISADGTPQSIAYIRSGTSPQLADWSLPPAGFVGWDAMDQILRGMAGIAPASGVLPIQLLDTSNIGTPGTNLFPNFNNYQSKFEQLWGLGG
jgi:ribose transport system substrate-binding protein